MSFSTSKASSVGFAKTQTVLEASLVIYTDALLFKKVIPRLVVERDKDCFLLCVVVEGLDSRIVRHRFLIKDRTAENSRRFFSVARNITGLPAAIMHSLE
jgi:hypothetical protein